MRRFRDLVIAKIVAIFAQDTGVSDVISNILGELTLNEVIAIIERFARRTPN